MKSKILVSLVLLSSLLFSMVGCSESATENVTDSSKVMAEESNVESPFKVGSEIYSIDPTKENMISLGSFQSVAIMNVLKDHGVDTGFSEESTKERNVSFNKSPEAFQTDGSIGFQSYTPNLDKLNFISSKDEVEGNSYYLNYKSEVDKNLRADYKYNVTMDFPLDREFKSEDFILLKDLVRATIDKDYNFEELDKLVQTYYRSIEDGSTFMEEGVSKSMGPYIITINNGFVETFDGVKSNSLRYEVRLRY